MIPYNKRQDAQIVKIKDYINGKGKYVTGEGTSITLENTVNTPFNNIILKGNTSQQKYSGKNLLNVISNVNDTYNGITFSIEKNGFQLKLNGTSQNNTRIAIGLNKIQLPQTGTYYLVVQIVSGSVSNSFGLGINFGKNNAINLSNSTKSGKISFNATKTTGYLALFTQSNISFNNLIINFQVISTDTLDLDFEPYVGGSLSPNPSYPQDIKVVTGDNTITISNSDNTEKQELPISLGSLELCKIDNYQDYIYKQDDKWYKHKVIDKIQLLSSYNWKQYVGINYFTMSERKYINQTYLPCNCFNNIICSSPGSDNPKNNINIYDYQKDNSSTITLDELKTILDTKDVYVYLGLITPIEEEITDTTLISQLNELEKAVSYDDTTNISQTNANLPFIINAEAVKKLL